MNESTLNIILARNKIIDDSTLVEILEYLSAFKKQSVNKQISLLTLLLEHINLNNLDRYRNYFINIYYSYPSKSRFLPLILKIGNKIAALISINQQIEFLDQYVVDFPNLGLIVALHYTKKDPERALLSINKIDNTALFLNEKKQYYYIKKDIYKTLGSKKMVTKCLVDLFILGEYHVYEEIKQNMTQSEFKLTYQKMAEKLSFIEDSDIHALHTIFLKEYDVNNLIRYYKFFGKEVIYEDIAYFKIINIEYAKRIYEYYLLNIVLENDFDIDLLIRHLYDLDIEYKYQEWTNLLAKIKVKVSAKNYQKILISLTFIKEEKNEL